MPESAQDAFNRGYESGRVNTRLDVHDAQLASMTNTLAKVVDVEAQLTLTVSSLGKDALARDDKAVALALALKEAVEERRNKETERWTPKSQLIAAGVFIVAVIGVWIQWKIATGK
jgi:hypothetical protein